MFAAKLEGAIGDGIEDVAGAGLEFFAGGDVVPERGAGYDRANPGREADEVEGWDCAAGASEEHHSSAWAQTGEGLLEGGFAN